MSCIFMSCIFSAPRMTCSAIVIKHILTHPVLHELQTLLFLSIVKIDDFVTFQKVQVVLKIFAF